MTSMSPTIAAHQTLRSAQQRTHERIGVKVPGVLRVPEARCGTYLITVLDASKTGLRISSPVGVPAGTRVEVRMLGATVMGVARYAREVDREFHVGIEADAVQNLSAPVQTEEFDLTSLFLKPAAGLSRRS
jgi:hypothetical protein